MKLNALANRCGGEFLSRICLLGKIKLSLKIANFGLISTFLNALFDLDKVDNGNK